MMRKECLRPRRAWLGIVGAAGLGIALVLALLAPLVGRKGDSVVPAGVVDWLLGDHDFYRPRVKATPDPATVYRLEVLVGLRPGDPVVREEVGGWVRARCSQVNRTFARTKTVVRLVPAEKLAKELGRRSQVGNPPDVVLFPPGAFADFGILQVDLRPFMAEQEARALVPAALQGVTKSNRLLGWPLGLRLSLWAVVAANLGRAGLDIDAWADGSLTLSQLTDTAATTGVALAIASPDALYARDLLLTGAADDGLALLATAAKEHSKTQSSPLAAFLAGRALALAPVSARLADLLMNRDESPDAGIALLPSPAAAVGSRGPSSEVCAVSVFRGKGRHFKGHEQVRVAVQVARSLAQDSATLCSSVLILPAAEDAEVAAPLRLAARRRAQLTCLPPVTQQRKSGSRQRLEAEYVRIVEGIARNGLDYEQAREALHDGSTR